MTHAKVYAQTAVGIYAGLSIALVFFFRHELSALAALALAAVLAIGQAALSGYVWEFARRGDAQRPRIPAPLIAGLGGIVLFVGTLVMWMRK